MHYNTKYESLGVAAPEPDGLAVLGFFIEVSLLFKRFCFTFRIYCTYKPLFSYVDPLSYIVNQVLHGSAIMMWLVRQLTEQALGFGQIKTKYNFLPRKSTFYSYSMMPL